MRTVNLGAILGMTQPAARKLVLIALCQQADSYGRAQVSQSRLGELAGLSQGVVGNALHWLSENNLIVKNPLRVEHSPECYAISARFFAVARPEPCPKLTEINGCDWPDCDCAISETA